MIWERLYRGGFGQYSNTRLAAHCVSRLTLKRHLQAAEIFFKLSSTPECHALRGHRAFGS
jgi:hypothetical protein